MSGIKRHTAEPENTVSQKRRGKGLDRPLSPSAVIHILMSIPTPRFSEQYESVPGISEPLLQLFSHAPGQLIRRENRIAEMKNPNIIDIFFLFFVVGSERLVEPTHRTAPVLNGLVGITGTGHRFSRVFLGDLEQRFFADRGRRNTTEGRNKGHLGLSHFNAGLGWQNQMLNGERHGPHQNKPENRPRRFLWRGDG